MLKEDEKSDKMTTDKTRVMLRVTGRVKKDREYSLGELLDMDQVETAEMLLACGSGEPKGRLGSCSGVLLTDVINGSEVITTAHNDTKKMYVVVSATDGYITVFSWQELFNTSIGEGVIVILEKDGKNIYAENGRVDLFSAKDFLTGPRYVKQLATIKIIMIE